MTYFRPTHATDRYPGTRWKILFGRYGGVQAFAVNEIQRAMQAFVPYTLEVTRATSDELLEDTSAGVNLLVIGTPEDNPLIDSLLRNAGIRLPSHDEGYCLSSMPAPWNAEQRVVLIAGRTAVGVLYGVEDFNTRILGSQVLKNDPLQVTLPEPFPVFCFSESPRIANRGIWTWGYVIYDYRGFLDNMARLRMNMLTVWNDCPPINMPQIIEYAHDRGIRIVLGFPWGWGMELDLADPDDQQRLKEDVLEAYERDYSHLQHDGIYFQTLTETNKRTVGSRPRAMVACELVNDISAALLERHPDLQIQFGLHATSILDDYHMLEPLDKRVTITWEDAGVIPYAYDVLNVFGSPENTTGRSPLSNIDATIDYSRKIAGLRKDCCFAMVAKGFTTLRWASEFEHHGEFILGERSNNFMRMRLDREQAGWERKNGLWFAHHSDAAHFYQEVLAANPDNMIVTALVEDGLFEHKVQPCVSLFSQILWNPDISTEDLMIRANSAYLTGNI